METVLAAAGPWISPCPDVNSEALRRQWPGLDGCELRSRSPGRLRVRVPASLWDAVLAGFQSLERQGVVSAVVPNLGLRSLLVRYDPQRPEAEVLQQAHAALLALLARLAAVEPARRPAPPAAQDLRAAGRSVDWEVRSDLPGRLRAQHPLVRRYPDLAASLGSTLLQLDGVSSYTVSAATGSVLVVYDVQRLPREQLLATLEEIVQNGLAEIESGGARPGLTLPRPASLQLGFSTLNLALSGASLAAPALAPLAVLTTAVAAAHIFGSALRSLLVDRKVKVDVLDATVIGLSLSYGYVLPGAFMIWVVDTGDAMLESATQASRRMMSQIFGRQVRKARRLADGEEIEVDVASLEAGDVVVIGAGEQVPVDGVIVDGEAVIDQHILTGEFAPAELSVASPVFAMTLVLAGRIVVRVTEKGADTRASQIVRIIEDSTQHKIQLQTLGERFADIMVLPTLALGGIGYWRVGSGAMMAIINADFGTGIRVAGPMALHSSLSLAASHGIVVKNGRVLESIHNVDAVVFDKTGTLTEDTPKVGRILTCDPDFDERRVLSYVACAEQRFTHPIARAVLQRAAEEGVELLAVEAADYRIGFGVEVTLGGSRLKIGSRRYLEREGIPIAGLDTAYLEEVYARGGSAIFAVLDDRLIGALELTASPRSEGFEVIRSLRRRGVEHIYLLSGDQEDATRVMAGRLGIDHYFAEVLPEEKGSYIRKLQSEGHKVAMVGDGINDSVALSMADYSISLRGAADVATDISDVIFLDGDLSRFDLLFDISANLRRNVQESFWLTLVPNSVCIAGALAGVFGFGTSLIFNNVFNMVATLNGLRPYFALKREQERDGPVLLPSPS